MAFWETILKTVIYLSRWRTPTNRRRAGRSFLSSLVFLHWSKVFSSRRGYTKLWNNVENFVNSKLAPHMSNIGLACNFPAVHRKLAEDILCTYIKTSMSEVSLRLCNYETTGWKVCFMLGWKSSGIRKVLYTCTHFLNFRLLTNYCPALLPNISDLLLNP